MGVISNEPGASSKIGMSTSTRNPDSLSMSALSVILIGPHNERRRALARVLAGPQTSVVKEFSAYPREDNLADVLNGEHDVVIIDLDPDPERALDLIEAICSTNAAITVMVYSGQTDPELLVRCMRAGAREFLTEPVAAPAVAEAFVRASARRQEVRRQKKTAGKMLVFAGTKGGSGVTTVASNFALALSNECKSSVALVDLNLHLGDAALTLGLTPQFSIVDALQNVTRLDSDFLATLLVKHKSGLAVLPAPDNIAPLQPTEGGIEKLLRVVRQDFQYVVVDAGSNLASHYETLFDMADTVYLVTQVSVPELRNAHRIVTRYFNGNAKLEIVLNRFVPRATEIDEDSITKALTRPAKWKVPNDYTAARRAQNTGTPMISEKTPVTKVLVQMAKTACGAEGTHGKKKRFGLFG